MLASTVQFSKYGDDRSHPTPPAPDNPGGTTGMKPSHQKKHPTPTGAGPFPQDPTACLQPAPRTTAFHAHPEGASRTSGDTRSPAELVSVPPLSSVTDTRAPPRLETLHDPRTALDHTHEVCAASAP